MPDTTYIALVDDHVLLRNGLASLVNSFDGYKVLLEAKNGEDFIKQLKPRQAPNIVLMDIKMPVMNGYETAKWITDNLPQTKVLALSVMDDEIAIIRMVRCGAKGYIVKDSETNVFRKALNSVRDHGIYINELVSNKIFHYVKNEDKNHDILSFSDREMMFLKLICTDKTYKQIAADMGVSSRTVDGYRDALFEKIGVSSRTGLVLYAIKTGIVTL
ncbi:MAG: response regulator transcription factor [Chitinophagaceae bacterium]